MAEIAKWGATQVLPILRHNMRRLKDGNMHGNKSIQPELTSQNEMVKLFCNTTPDSNYFFE